MATFNPPFSNLTPKEQYDYFGVVAEADIQELLYTTSRFEELLECTQEVCVHINTNKKGQHHLHTKDQDLLTRLRKLVEVS